MRTLRPTGSTVRRVAQALTMTSECLECCCYRFSVLLLSAVQAMDRVEAPTVPTWNQPEEQFSVKPKWWAVRGKRDASTTSAMSQGEVQPCTRYASDEGLDAAWRPFFKKETKQRMKRIRDQVVFWPLAAVLAVPTLTVLLPFMGLGAVCGSQSRDNPPWLDRAMEYITAPCMICIILARNKLFGCPDACEH